jgi:hypothetical protein
VTEGVSSGMVDRSGDINAAEGPGGTNGDGDAADAAGRANVDGPGDGGL